MKIRVSGAIAVGFGLAVALLMVGTGCGGGGPRNCLVIPAQIDLVKERRDALLDDLENTAKRVDRQAATLETAKQRLKDLQREKALIDSLSNTAAKPNATD